MWTGAPLPYEERERRAQPRHQPLQESHPEGLPLRKETRKKHNKKLAETPIPQTHQQCQRCRRQS